MSRCDHQPKPGTCATLAGAPADLMNHQHYPITALCLYCGLVIRSEQFLVSSGRIWTIVRGPF